MTATLAQQRALRGVSQDILRLDEPMSAHTSFRVGGPAMLFVEPPDMATLCKLLAFCAGEELPWTAIGRGTNLLVSDNGYAGAILHFGKAWDWMIIADEKVDAGPGCLLSKLARRAAHLGLSGLEFASGIPGSVGGAVAMNAGAFGGSMANVVERVECLAPGGEEITLSNADLRFAYRHSRVLDERLIVCRVHLALRPADPLEIQRQMEAFHAQRKARQPWSSRSAGSVFRNPPGDAAGRLIEAAGCKGLRAGGAVVSPKHANFIVNPGEATASDIALLISEVQRRVWDQFGVWLQPEITLLGEFDPPMPGGPPA
jgi:UDP-N-acetylmuramate dehydrogenase